MTASTKLLRVRVNYTDYEQIDKNIERWHKVGPYRRKAWGWSTPAQLVSYGDEYAKLKPLKIFAYDLLNKEAAKNSVAAIRIPSRVAPNE